MKNTINIVIQYDDRSGKMEAFLFLSVENAMKWCRARCHSKYWVDESQEFMDEPGTPLVKEIYIVVTSCFYEGNSGTCSFPFYQKRNAEKWLKDQIRYADRTIKDLGYTTTTTSEEVLAKENERIHFSGWIVPCKEIMDAVDYTCYEEPFTGAVFSKAGWLDWYEKRGLKDNFASPEDWWDEMLRMGLLVPSEKNNGTDGKSRPRLSEVVTQQCNCCGRQFDVRYYSDGTYEYQDEGAVCGCDSDFSPVQGPSLAEWLGEVNPEPKSLHRFLVFIKAGYIRDAQAYFGDEAYFGDDDDEDHWKDVDGELLVLDRFAASAKEVAAQVRQIYPDAPANMFSFVEIPD